MKPKVEEDNSNSLLCPMPGLLIAVNVQAGEEVVSGQVLCTVEAMKMENIIKAEKASTIKKINSSNGDSLEVDQVILEFD